MDTVKNNEAIKLPTGKNLVLSSSPHLSVGASLQKIMGGVLLALLPAVIAAVYFFGLRALLVIVYTTLCCVIAEAVWCYFAGKPALKTVCDGSAAVTGLLLALCLPVSIPLYVPPIGAVLAIWLAKQVYGGLGHNPFNPALVARVGLLIALPAAMTAWTPSRGMKKENYPQQQMFISKADAETCATPLGVAKTAVSTPEKEDAVAGEVTESSESGIENKELFVRYFLGDRAGCLGETSVLALLLGFLILVAFNLINWRVPVLFVGTVALITFAVNRISPETSAGSLFHILNGGLLLGAIFMATDMVTSPITGLGCVVFAIGCGVVTSVIRIWGNYPEGVSFSILFMNALVPLIDRWCGGRPFGYVRERKGDAK